MGATDLRARPMPLLSELCSNPTRDPAWLGLCSRHSLIHSISPSSFKSGVPQTPDRQPGVGQLGGELDCFSAVGTLLPCPPLSRYRLQSPCVWLARGEVGRSAALILCYSIPVAAGPLTPDMDDGPTDLKWDPNSMDD